MASLGVRVTDVYKIPQRKALRRDQTNQAQRSLTATNQANLVSLGKKGGPATAGPTRSSQALGLDEAAE